MTKRLFWFLPAALMFAGLVLICERPAYAYTDPGTGLLAIQALGSTLVAAGWYLRRKIYSLFRRDTPLPVAEDAQTVVSAHSDESAQAR